MEGVYALMQRKVHLSSIICSFLSLLLLAFPSKSCISHIFEFLAAPYHIAFVLDRTILHRGRDQHTWGYQSRLIAAIFRDM